MGYKTHHNIRILTKDPEKFTAAAGDVLDLARRVGGEIAYDANEINFDADSWGGYEDDLTTLCKKHSDVIFELFTDGEDSDDKWKQRWQNDRVETVRFDFSDLNEFTEILTEEEEEKAFAKEYERYTATRKRLVEYARRRIAQVKDRISGHRGSHLDIKPLTDDGPECRVMVRVPCMTDASPVGVDGICPDGFRICGDDGEEYDLDDLSAEDIRNVVLMVEGYEKDLAAGRLAGFWDEDEETFRLRRAA